MKKPYRFLVLPDKVTEEINRVASIFTWMEIKDYQIIDLLPSHCWRFPQLIEWLEYYGLGLHCYRVFVTPPNMVDSNRTIHRDGGIRGRTVQVSLNIPVDNFDTELHWFEGPDTGISYMNGSDIVVTVPYNVDIEIPKASQNENTNKASYEYTKDWTPAYSILHHKPAIINTGEWHSVTNRTGKKRTVLSFVLKNLMLDNLPTFEQVANRFNAIYA